MASISQRNEYKIVVSTASDLYLYDRSAGKDQLPDTKLWLLIQPREMERLPSSIIPSESSVSDGGNSELGTSDNSRISRSRRNTSIDIGGSQRGVGVIHLLTAIFVVVSVASVAVVVRKALFVTNVGTSTAYAVTTSTTTSVCPTDGLPMQIA